MALVRSKIMPVRLKWAIIAAIACPLVTSDPLHAAGVTMQCARADVFNPNFKAPITFAFDGDPRGTFKVGGVFGDFAIPASRRSVQTKSGKTIEMILGAAKAHVQKLPALSDVEACIDKIPGTRTATVESDAFLDARDQCLRELPAAAAGVDVMARIEMTLDNEISDGEDGYVLFKLTYDAPSRAPTREMVVEAFPTECRLKK